MSRIGKKPIEIPGNVKIDKKDTHIGVTGPKGTLSMDITGDINVKVEGTELTFTERKRDKEK